MTISTTIKKIHLADKFMSQREKGWFIERKACTDYWKKRIEPLAGKRTKGLNLLCGKQSYKAVIGGVVINDTPIELKHVIETDKCYEILASFSPESIGKWNTLEKK